MIFAYSRVSTTDQNNERQLIALNNYAENHNFTIDRFFDDKATGRNFNRIGYTSLKAMLRSGDILIITELDRLGRDMAGIKREWNELLTLGVDIIVTENEILNTANKSDLEKKLISNIVFELLSYMAEKERLKILSRQAEGIKIAKDNGKYKGRTPIIRDDFIEVYTKWKAGDITGVQATTLLSLSKATFYRKIKEYEKGV